MSGRHLQVTFRKGRAFAAYLYLPRPFGTKSVRTEQAAEGILVDYGEGGEAIGIEITAPGHVQLEELNAVLERLGEPRSTREEFSPLVAREVP